VTVVLGGVVDLDGDSKVNAGRRLASRAPADRKKYPRTALTSARHMHDTDKIIDDSVFIPTSFTKNIHIASWHAFIGLAQVRLQ
jgi:hypothetical protein